MEQKKVMAPCLSGGCSMNCPISGRMENGVFHPVCSKQEKLVKTALASRDESSVDK